MQDLAKPRPQNADPFDAALGRDPDGSRLDSENVAVASKSDGNRDTEKLVWYGSLGTSTWVPYQLGSYWVTKLRRVGRDPSGRNFTGLPPWMS